MFQSLYQKQRCGDFHNKYLTIGNESSSVLYSPKQILLEAK